MYVCMHACVRLHACLCAAARCMCMCMCVYTCMYIICCFTAFPYLCKVYHTNAGTLCPHYVYQFNSSQQIHIHISYIHTHTQRHTHTLTRSHTHKNTQIQQQITSVYMHTHLLNIIYLYENLFCRQRARKRGAKTARSATLDSRLASLPPSHPTPNPTSTCLEHILSAMSC